MGRGRTRISQSSHDRHHLRSTFKKGLHPASPISLETDEQGNEVIVDSPQSRLQRLVLKNYALFIMDVLPTRKPETVESILPVAMRYFAEVPPYFYDGRVSYIRRCVIIPTIYQHGFALSMVL